MSLGDEGRGRTPEPVGGLSAATQLDKDERHAGRLADMARAVDRQRARIDEIYWPIAKAKGINKGDSVEVAGVKVLGLILKGPRCFVVLNDASGFNREEIALDDPFWDEERSWKVEEKTVEKI